MHPAPHPAPRACARTTAPAGGRIGGLRPHGGLQPGGSAPAPAGTLPVQSGAECGPDGAGGAPPGPASIPDMSEFVSDGRSRTTVVRRCLSNSNARTATVHEFVSPHEPAHQNGARVRLRRAPAHQRGAQLHTDT